MHISETVKLEIKTPPRGNHYFWKHPYIHQVQKTLGIFWGPTRGGAAVRECNILRSLFHRSLGGIFWKKTSWDPMGTHEVFEWSSRWWFHTFFMFTRKLGKISRFDEYFSKGLKPPTSHVSPEIFLLVHFCGGLSKFLGPSKNFMAHSKKITRINVWAIFLGGLGMK